MSKFCLRIIAALLVSCLIADPSLAAVMFQQSFAGHNLISAQHALFETEAIPAGLIQAFTAVMPLAASQRRFESGLTKNKSLAWMLPILLTLGLTGMADQLKAQKIQIQLRRVDPQALVLFHQEESVPADKETTVYFREFLGKLSYTVLIDLLNKATSRDPDYVPSLQAYGQRLNIPIAMNAEIHSFTDRADIVLMTNGVLHTVNLDHQADALKEAVRQRPGELTEKEKNIRGDPAAVALFRQFISRLSSNDLEDLLTKATHRESTYPSALQSHGVIQMNIEINGILINADVVEAVTENGKMRILNLAGQAAELQAELARRPLQIHARLAPPLPDNPVHAKMVIPGWMSSSVNQQEILPARGRNIKEALQDLVKTYPILASIKDTPFTTNGNLRPGNRLFVNGVEVPVANFGTTPLSERDHLSIVDAKPKDIRIEATLLPPAQTLGQIRMQVRSILITPRIDALFAQEEAVLPDPEAEAFFRQSIHQFDFLTLEDLWFNATARNPEYLSTLLTLTHRQITLDSKTGDIIEKAVVLVTQNGLVSFLNLDAQINLLKDEMLQKKPALSPQEKAAQQAASQIPSTPVRATFAVPSWMRRSVNGRTFVPVHGRTVEEALEGLVRTYRALAQTNMPFTADGNLKSGYRVYLDGKEVMPAQLSTTPLGQWMQLSISNDRAEAKPRASLWNQVHKNLPLLVIAAVRLGTLAALGSFAFAHAPAILLMLGLGKTLLASKGVAMAFLPGFKLFNGRLFEPKDDFISGFGDEHLAPVPKMEFSLVYPTQGPKATGLLRGTDLTAVADIQKQIAQMAPQGVMQFTFMAPPEIPLGPTEQRQVLAIAQQHGVHVVLVQFKFKEGPGFVEFARNLENQISPLGEFELLHPQTNPHLSARIVASNLPISAYDPNQDPDWLAAKAILAPGYLKRLNSISVGAIATFYPHLINLLAEVINESGSIGNSRGLEPLQQLAETVKQAEQQVNPQNNSVENIVKLKSALSSAILKLGGSLPAGFQETSPTGSQKPVNLLGLSGNGADGFVHKVRLFTTIARESPIATIPEYQRIGNDGVLNNVSFEDSAGGQWTLHFNTPPIGFTVQNLFVGDPADIQAAQGEPDSDLGQFLPQLANIVDRIDYQPKPASGLASYRSLAKISA